MGVPVIFYFIVSPPRQMPSYSRPPANSQQKNINNLFFKWNLYYSISLQLPAFIPYLDWSEAKHFFTKPYRADNKFLNKDTTN